MPTRLVPPGTRCWTRPCPTVSGAIAQLGERLLCKQEVVGSIPSGSTILAMPGFRVHSAFEGGNPSIETAFACRSRWADMIFDIVKKGFDFPCHGAGRVQLHGSRDMAGRA
jgi:hypothetical protein